MTDDAYRAEIDAWRSQRLAALTAPDGWLNLTDRVEISPGTYQVGSGPENDVHLSVGPSRLGELVLAADGTGTFDEGTGAHAFVAAGDNPPRLEAGGLLLEVTEIEGQHALRVRQIDAPSRLAFAGIESFPLDPAWRVEAEWRALSEPERLGIDTVKGIRTSVSITHEARFTHDGAEVLLLPTHWKGGKPMFVIRDRTSGPETYGAARFLIGDVRGDRVVLDFNKAFNPPCAFTDFAVCPLPPAENVLPIRIEAGEKRPH